MTNTRQSRALRIIVMDDEPLVLDSVSMLLESMGHEILPTNNGQEVIDLLANEATPEADIAILDLTVRTGLGGSEIKEQLRTIAPGMKLVASSGYTNDPIMQAPGVHGFDEKLEKPYSLFHVTALIERLQNLND